jgi:hypothetical protein
MNRATRAVSAPSLLCPVALERVVGKSFVSRTIYRPALRFMSAALRDTARHSIAKIVRQADVQDSVWLLSFWKEVCRQYPFEWRTPNSMVDPVVGYVNLSIIERKNLQGHQAQFVAESR